jgi:hypothetical protein
MSKLLRAAEAAERYITHIYLSLTEKGLPHPQQLLLDQLRTEISKHNKIGMVPAGNFCKTVQANVDNEKLSDADFREFIRNTLPIVIMED